MRAGDTPSAPVQIRAGAALLDGDLTVPPDALGLVVFAHGSGSSRFSSRNRAVATALVRAGFATLLLDLLTPAEEAIDERTREYRFDIARLAHRVVAAIDWAKGVPALARVHAPTLLIVGGADEPVIALNRSAMLRMDAAQLVIVPGATHLFEERGALEHVAELAVRWCTRHLAPQPAAKKPLTRAAAS